MINVKKEYFLKRIILSLVFLLQITLLFAQKNFSFVFLPDLHLRPDSSVLATFDRVSGQINRLKPSFALTGGDMIYTAKSVDDKKAEILFDLMDSQLKKLKMPVFLTMGNHETVGITAESGIDSSNPMWGERMYEKRYNESYYTFNYSGWKFFILDGIRIREKEKDYTSGVDPEQIEWLKSELSSTDINTPIVLVIHTPLINPHAISDSNADALSRNSEDVLDLFSKHDLRIVLQGHNHIYMNLFINGIHYISGGSSAYGTRPEDNGFILVKIKKSAEKITFIPVLKN